MSAVIASFRGALRRKVSTLAVLIRDDPREVVRILGGRPEKYVAYVADPHQVPAPEPIPGWQLCKLTDDALMAISRTSEELSPQGERLAEGRANDAYALYIDANIAGIAWMIPHMHDVDYPVRNVKLRHGEVEITHCVTLPEFRGRGVYTYMIRALCGLACEQEVRRVFMITNCSNVASQGGIAKAGLKAVGGIHRHVFTYLGPRASVTIRRHRWGPFGWP